MAIRGRYCLRSAGSEFPPDNTKLTCCAKSGFRSHIKHLFEHSFEVLIILCAVVITHIEPLSVHPLQFCMASRNSSEKNDEFPPKRDLIQDNLKFQNSGIKSDVSIKSLAMLSTEASQIFLAISIAYFAAVGIASANQETSSTNKSASNGNLLILVPANSNLTDPQVPDGQFNLFKLDTSVLFDLGDAEETDNDSGRDKGHGDSRNHGSSMYSSGLSSGNRDARRMNLLSGLWNRPKASPLYLVNGTVCRFINSSPICTTLATTGLLRK